MILTGLRTSTMGWIDDCPAQEDTLVARGGDLFLAHLSNFVGDKRLFSTESYQLPSSPENHSSGGLRPGHSRRRIWIGVWRGRTDREYWSLDKFVSAVIISMQKLLLAPTATALLVGTGSSIKRNS